MAPRRLHLHRPGPVRAPYTRTPPAERQDPRRASRVATPRSITHISPPWPAAGTSTLLMEAPLTFVAATGETARVASHTHRLVVVLTHSALLRARREYYSFFSAPRVAVNVRTQDATFRLHNLHDQGGTLIVDGSFITEAGTSPADAPSCPPGPPPNPFRRL